MIIILIEQQIFDKKQWFETIAFKIESFTNKNTKHKTSRNTTKKTYTKNHAMNRAPILNNDTANKG
jgi:hypothetical protein